MDDEAAGLPWMRSLPSSAVGDLVAEIADSVGVAAACTDMAPVVQLLAEWRHTAEVYADSELHAVLARYHEGDHGAVPRPGTA
nr:hypothetical protein [Micromonospora sp. DSM 115978]